MQHNTVCMGKTTPLDTLECWDESSASCGHQVTRGVPHELQGTVVRSESVRHEQCSNPGAQRGIRSDSCQVGGHLCCISRWVARPTVGLPAPHCTEPVSSFSRGQEPPGKNPWSSLARCGIHWPVASFTHLVLILIVFIVVERDQSTTAGPPPLDCPRPASHRHRPRPPPPGLRPHARPCNSEHANLGDSS